MLGRHVYLRAIATARCLLSLRQPSELPSYKKGAEFFRTSASDIVYNIFPGSSKCLFIYTSCHCAYHRHHVLSFPCSRIPSWDYYYSRSGTLYRSTSFFAFFPLTSLSLVRTSDASLQQRRTRLRQR